MRMIPGASLTVTQIAERFAVDRDVVVAWIKTGQLAAVDVSRAKRTLPRWRITPEALREFELSRSSVKPAKPQRAQRRAKRPADFVEYF